ERTEVALARHGGQRGRHHAAQVVDLPGPAGEAVKRQTSRLLVLDVDLDRPAICPLDLAWPFVTGEEVPHVAVTGQPPAEKAVHVALNDLLVSISADHSGLVGRSHLAEEEVVIVPLG